MLQSWYEGKLKISLLFHRCSFLSVLCKNLQVIYLHRLQFVGYICSDSSFKWRSCNVCHNEGDGHLSLWDNQRGRDVYIFWGSCSAESAPTQGLFFPANASLAERCLTLLSVIVRSNVHTERRNWIVCWGAFQMGNARGVGIPAFFCLSLLFLRFAGFSVCFVCLFFYKLINHFAVFNSQVEIHIKRNQKYRTCFLCNLNARWNIGQNDARN